MSYVENLKDFDYYDEDRQIVLPFGDNFVYWSISLNSFVNLVYFKRF